MKLIVILTIASILEVSAKGYAQRITISQNRLSLEQLLREIRRQTSYNVLCDGDALQEAQPVTGGFKNATVNTVLDKSLLGQPLLYTINGNTIVIKKKAALPAADAKIMQQTVKGTVTDDKGEPLPGVTVRVKGTNTTTSTDVNGRYSISVPSSDAVLVFSFIGFQSTEVTPGTRATVNVKLTSSSNSLNEVAVVGFGTQRKISLVGAQSTVQPTELKLPVANITTSLAGRLAGVVAVQRSGEPGRNGADIWIRGIATFGGNTSSPLILVDGVERSISNLDPEDIESFTVLKDASGTAVYGVRGANGVVLVRTKTGKVGKPQIFFDYNEGISTFTRRPKMADGITYMEAANEASVGRGLAPKYSQEYIDKTASGADPLLYPNVNWMDELFNKYSRNRRANLNASGGVENAQYYVSLAYYNESGFLKTSDFEKYNSSLNYSRYNFTSNLNLKITPTTKIDVGLQGYASNGNYPGENTQDIFGAAMDVPPVEYPLMYPGNFIPGRSSNGGFRNPYADLTRRGYRTEFRNQIYSNLRGTQDLSMLTKGLTATAMFSFDAYNEQTVRRSKRESTYFPDNNKPYNEDGTLNLVRTFSGNNYLSYEPSRGGTRQFYTEAAVNYDRGFGKHRVGALALFYAQDYNNPFAGDFTGSIPERYVGLAGRVTYSYDDRYFLELNGGYNGSELFAPENRYGFFPAIGLGWVPSNEKFFAPLRNVISFLKIRYSDGKTGIGKVNGRRFAYLTLLADNAEGYTFGRNFTNYSGINVTDYGVDIRWSESRKQDLGFEIRTLADKLSLIVDLFRERRTGIFLQRQSLAGFIGLTNSPFGNLGVVDNRGIDATLQHNMRLGKVDFSLKGTFTYNKDKLLNDDRPVQPYPWMSRIGDNVLSRYGYVAEKLFDSDEEIAGSAVPGDRSKVKPGDIKYKDLNGDGLINQYDVTRIGRGDIPSTIYGAGFNIGYKGFSLGALFQGVAHADILLGGSAIIPFNGGGGLSNAYANIGDRWTPSNPSQDVFYPRLAYGEDQNFNNAQESSWWVKDVSFVRLKTAQLSYNLPQAFTSKLHVKNASVYLIGLNLATFSKFKLWDPELNTNPPNSGRANGSKYPNTATLSLGLNVRF
ncbi:TonB-dependent receptor [Mucilaginibacter sp. Bleaf8]|uniref:TonB-dependent receptor n=1 Tax=Mucilaginibacter sp. Bleaf8 TaxID=2834430 RepID=UPI001BD18649|nr:TonB-dependent receptor [Mucilaginibacter sp. Bleaf8]MBS7564100.1 TonB-dependent receptor [Mucilaginibacter sp. Bleaf8]